MYEIERQTLVEQPTAVICDKVAVPDLPEWFGRVFSAVAAAIGRSGSTIAGPPFARYNQIGDEFFDVEAGFPVATPIRGNGDVVPSALPAGPAISTWHVGPYDTLTAGYDALSAWLEEHGATPSGPPWEVYVSEPQGDPATWRTLIVQPVTS